MPTILIEGYHCRFYSSDRVEPPHVHVLRGGNEAKIWLSPIQLERNRGYTEVEVRRILRIVSANSGRLLEVWHAYFRES